MASTAAITACSGGGGTPDTTPPQTSITATPTALSNSSTATFAFSADESNATFEVSVDGAVFAGAASPFRATGLADGAHTFSVRARDAAGNVDASSASFAWTVDTTAPTAQIVFPTGVSYTDAGTLTVRGSAQDTNGVSSVTVNGVAATTATGFASWSAAVPIAAGSNVVSVSVTDAAGNTAPSAASAQVTNKGTPTIAVRAMDTDASHDRILVVDQKLRALLAADRTTGRLSILSNRTHGSGDAFGSIENVVVDAVNDRALVLDPGQDTLFAVNLGSGDRTVISSGANSTTQTAFTLGSSITFDAADNAAFVAVRGNESVVRVDLGSGARSVVSSGTVGTGTSFVNPLDIVFDNATNPGTPRLLVADAGTSPKAIFAVDISTGNRTALSSSSPTGSGTALGVPLRMKLDAANSRVLVVDGDVNRNALVAVDLATGNRTTLADATTGTGFPLSLPFSVAFDTASNRAFVAATAGGEIVAVDLATLDRSLFADSNIGGGVALARVGGVARMTNVGGSSLLISDRSRHAILSLNLATGVRTEVSGTSRGAGTAFGDPTQLVLDAALSRALVVDFQQKAVIAVDLASGNRTAIGGSGPALNSPRDLALDAANNRVLVADVVLAPTIAGRLFALDLATGTRTIISDSGTGTGIGLILPVGVVLDDTPAAGPRALLSDDQQFGLIAVDPSDGSRHLFSSDGSAPDSGTGIPFLLPADTVLDAANGRLLATDTGHGNVISVDLATGNRTRLSGRNAADETALGTGPVLSFPSGIDADFANGVAFVASADHGAVMAVDIVTGERVMIAR